MTPQEQKKLNDLLKEGVELAKKLGLAADEASLKNFTGDLTQAERIVKSLRDEWKDYVKDISGAREGFARILDEIKGINSGVNRSKKAFEGLTSLAAKLQNHVDGTNRLSTKELEKLKQQTKQREDDLKLAGRLSKDRIKELEKLKEKGKLSTTEKKELKEAIISHQNISQEITRNAGHLRQFNTQLNEAVNAQKEIEKSLGVTGALMKGMSKIPFLGDLPGMSGVLGEVENEIAEIERTEKRIVGKTEAMSMAFKKMGPIIKDGLTDPLVISSFLLKKMLEGFTSLNQTQTEFTRETGHSYSYIEAASTSLTTMAQNIKQATALTQQFGMAADVIFTPETIREATEMVELMGMSNEEAGKLARIAKVNGNELKTNNEKIVATISNFNKLNKTGISGKAVLKDLSNTSDAIAMSFKGNVVAMAQTTAEAKKLGLNLDQVDKIAESLLNFEDSISAELEAELLTGKQINLEQARLYALNNDIAGLTKEISNNQELIDTFTGNNRIKQEAIAKTLGMSRDEMAKMIFDQRTTNGLTDEQAAKLANMSLEDMKRLSIQESINNSIAKMSEALAVPLSMLADMIAKVGEFKSLIVIISSLLVGKMLFGLVTGAAAMAGQVLSARAYSQALNQNLGKEAALTAMKVAGAEATSFGTVTGAIVAGLAVVGAAIAGFSMMKDGEIDPSKGPIMTGEFGSVQLDPNDKAMYGADGNIKVGTNLLGEKGGGGGNVSIDYDRLAAAMAKVQINLNTSVKVNEREIASATNNENLKGSSKLQ